MSAEIWQQLVTWFLTDRYGPTCIPPTALALVLLVSVMKGVVTRAWASVSAPSGDLVNQRSFEYAPIGGLARRLGGSSVDTQHGLSHVVIRGYEDCNSPACYCPRIYDPVCGTDNHTYPNECILNCAVMCHVVTGVFPAYHGPCNPYPLLVPSKEYAKGLKGPSAPINNWSLGSGYRGSEVDPSEPGTSKPSDICGCLVRNIIHPVCATDDKTYVNPDTLACAIKCHTTPATTKIAYYGRCKDDPTMDYH